MRCIDRSESQPDSRLNIPIFREEYVYEPFDSIDSNSFSKYDHSFVRVRNIDTNFWTIFHQTGVYEDGAHAKNLRRESGYISVSRHYPPPAIRIQRRRNVHPRRDYKIALPPPREIFNLVYYRPATLPSRPQTLSPLFRPRKLLHESLPSSQGWRRMEKPPFPCEEKIYRSYAVSKAVGGTAVKSWRFYAFSRSLERRRRVKYQFGLLQSDGLDRRYYYLNYASKIDLLRICCEYWRWINFENPWWKSGKSRFGNGLFSVEEDKTRGDRRGKSFRSAVARIACASLYLGEGTR